jgi:hypothetical protein
MDIGRTIQRAWSLLGQISLRPVERETHRGESLWSGPLAIPRLQNFFCTEVHVLRWMTRSLHPMVSLSARTTSLKLRPKRPECISKGARCASRFIQKRIGCLAGILLEELGQKMGLDGILGEEVLTPLNLQQTIIDSDRMEACSTMGDVTRLFQELLKAMDGVESTSSTAYQRSSACCSPCPPLPLSGMSRTVENIWKDEHTATADPTGQFHEVPQF